MSKLPWFQFYPGDWSKDPFLRTCSRAAKGLWIDLMCIMFECSPRGILAFPGGVPMSVRDIAIAAGGDVEQNMQLLEELLVKGVARRNEEGAIFSKRMMEDDQLRQVRAESGSKGGKAKAKQKRSKREAKAKQVSVSVSNSDNDSASSEEKKDSELEVFDCWRLMCNHPHAKLTPQRRALIRKRLKEGYTVEQLCNAVKGCTLSAYHQGQNEHGTIYDSLELILRSGEKVEQFIGYFENSKNGNTSGHRRAADSAERSEGAKATVEDHWSTGRKIIGEGPSRPM